MSRALRPAPPPNATALLARMLEDPALPDKLRQLSPPLLAELIRRVGLEDAGELVAFATTEQLVGAFDEDLWRNEQPGQEESFDAARFALWVEVLPDNGGLYEVLTSDDMLASDVAAEREERRTAAGYVAPASAASFLKLAANVGADGKVTAKERAEGIPERDPATRACFRDRGHAPARARTARGGLGGRKELDAVLTAAGASVDGGVRPPPDAGNAPSRLPATTQSFEATASRTLSALHALAEAGKPSLSERQEELAYLANLLVAGATVEQRRVRPVEAIRAAAAVAGVGLDELAGRAAPDASVAELIERHPLDVLFRLGWAELHRRARQSGQSFAYNDLDVMRAEAKPILTTEPGRAARRLDPQRR